VLVVSACRVRRRWACPYSGSVILLVIVSLSTQHGPVIREAESSPAVSTKVSSSRQQAQLKLDTLLNRKPVEAVPQYMTNVAVLLGADK